MNTRDTILNKAKHLFQYKGYSAVSMNDIVNEAGVAKPSIYHFFGDKEGLYTEVLVTMLANSTAYTNATFAMDIPYKQKLTLLAAGYFKYSPMVVSTLLRDAGVHLSDSNAKKVGDAMKLYMYAPFEQLFATAIQKGELTTSISAEDLALLFVTYLDTYTTLNRQQSSQNMGYKKAAVTMVDTLFKGIENYN